MRLSRFFLPILKENPKEAEIVSHRLMLRAGMIRQEAAGIYAWLPLGYRVLKKIEQIVREEQDRSGAILFFTNDALDVLQDAQPERQPAIDAGARLPDHAGAQHQPMRHDLGLFRILLKDRKQETRQSHGHTRGIGTGNRQ